jgi:hypothetical protein
MPDPSADLGVTCSKLTNHPPGGKTVARGAIAA